jgi:hypothetical protein
MFNYQFYIGLVCQKSSHIAFLRILQKQRFENNGLEWNSQLLFETFACSINTSYLQLF